MTSDQIKLLKESYYKKTKTPDGSRDTTLGEYTKFCLDGGIEFVSGKDIVVYDDANEMLHCMCLNSDAVSQANFPIKVISSSYEWVQQVEAILSRNNFETLLDEGFLSSILSDSQKEFIKKWAKTIGRIQAQQPSDAEPYYTQEPTVIPMYTRSLKRDDGITYPTPPATMNYEKNPKTIKAVSTPEALKEALAEGADVFISQPMTISEVMPISGNTVVNLGEGANITSTDTTRPFELEDGATLTINGGDAVVETGKYGLVNIKEGSNATVILNGGTYKSNTDNGSFIKPRGAGNIKVVMTGVEYVDESEDGFVLNVANTETTEDGKVNVSFIAEDCNLTCARGIQAAGDVEIRNCTINSSLQGIEVSVTNKPAIIENCTFVNTASVEGPVPSTCVGIGNGAEVVMSNCTLDSANHAVCSYSYATMTMTNCDIINGDIKNDDGVINVDGKYAVSSIKAMETAMNLGDNILIGSDMTMDAVVSVSGDKTIDIFKNADLSTDYSVKRPFSLVDNASLTVNATGKEISVGKYGFVRIDDAATNANIVLNGGTYNGNTDKGSFVLAKGGGNIDVQMNGVTYTDESDNGFVINVAAVTDINNTKFEINNCNLKTAIGIQVCGDVSINNSTITSTNTCVELTTTTNPAVIENCNMICDATVEGICPPSCLLSGNGAESVIRNCTFDSANHAIFVASDSTVNVNDCEFINGDIKNDVGVVCIDGKYAISSVKAMEKAITLGDNILIGSDMTMDSTVNVTNDMIIDFFKDADLNVDPAKVNRPFEMANESSLTINATGKEITLGKYGLVNIPIESELVNITLNGGTYKSNMDNGAIIKPRGVCNSTVRMIDVTCIDESNDSFIMNINNMDIYNSSFELVVEGGSYTCANGFQCPAGTRMKDVTFNVMHTAIETNGLDNAFTESTFDNCVFNVSEEVNIGSLPTPTAIGAGHYSIAVLNNCTIDSVANALYVYSTPGKIYANNCNIINGKLDNTYGEIYIDGVLVA